MPRRRAATSLALACLLAVPASAAAAPRVGSDEDRGPVDPAGQRDIRTVAVVYDTPGVLRAAVAMGGPVTPTNLSGIEVGLGTYSVARGWCDKQADLTAYPPEVGYEEEGPFGGLYIGSRDTKLDPAITLANGLFTITADTPLVASKGWNCARVESFGPEEEKGDYKVHDTTEVFPLIAGAAPNAVPRCSLVTKRVRRGGTVAFRCADAAGPLTVRFYQDNRLERAKATRVGSRGGAAVKARGLRRGAYEAIAWRGKVIIGQGRVGVR